MAGQTGFEPTLIIKLLNKIINKCVKLVPLSFEKSNQIIRELIKIRENILL